MKGKLTITGVNFVFFMFAILSIAFSVLLIAFASLVKIDMSGNKIYIFLALNEFGIILLPSVVYVIRNKINLKETLGFKKIGIFPAILIIILSIPGYFIAAALNTIMLYFLQFVGKINVSPIPTPQNIPELLLGIAVIAVTPAICEEFLNRGLLLRAYEKRGSYRAIAITAVFFALFHMDISNFFAPIFWGAMFGYYVLRTDSIFAGMIAHFMNNSIAMVIQYLSRNEVKPKTLSVSAGELGSTLLIGAIALAVFVPLFMLFRYITRGKREFKPAISTLGKDIKSIFSHWPIVTFVVLYVVFTALMIIETAVAPNVTP
jgi:membrane protease YdiL (CAAX protease family)